MSEKSLRIDEKRVDTAPPPRRGMLLELGLDSGSRLLASAVMLYQRTLVEQVMQLRVSAFALLQADAAFATSADAMTLTPAILVAAMRQHVSARKAEDAAALLQEAEVAVAAMRKAGRLFRVTEIDGADAPHPHLWSHAEAVVEQRSRGFIITREVNEEIEQYWIHDGDRFVTIRDEQGIRRDVRWSAVEQFRLAYADEI